MNEDLSKALLDRLMFVLMKEETPNLDALKSRFTIILNDYKVEPKEEALVVWTEGKNEYLIKRFLLAKATAGCAKRTLEEYEKGLNRILGAIGKDADTITAIDLQVYFARLAQRLTPAGAKNYYLTLSSFLTWMHNEDLIQKNPIKRVEPPKLRKQKKPAFTEMEVERLRDACVNYRERAIIETLLSTGCRAAELSSIKMSDIEGARIDILGKGEKHRNVFLNAKAQVAITNYLEERSDCNPYLFPKMNPNMRSRENFGKMKMRSTKGDWYKNPEAVDPLEHMGDSNTLNNVLHSIANRAGVANVHAHRFRRTCATMALRRGMPIEQVSRMLGHENIGTTQIYLDLDDKTLEMDHEKYVV